MLLSTVHEYIGGNEPFSILENGDDANAIGYITDAHTKEP